MVEWREVGGKVGGKKEPRESWMRRVDVAGEFFLLFLEKVIKHLGPSVGA